MNTQINFERYPTLQGALSFEPQSEQYQKEQNVIFSDTSDENIATIPSFIDYTRDVQHTDDTSLENFFSRPVKVKNFTWPVNTSLFELFNPWQLFFENKRVGNRISNFRLARCKLHVKFVINGNPFCYGRLLASYNPNHTFDTLTKDRAFFEHDLIEASQRPSVYLNPTRNEGAELALPFFWFENLIDITGASYQDMGIISLRSIGNLLMASSSTSSVQISVFVWATDVVLSVPTQFNTGVLLPQADEYALRPVSTIASNIANMAAQATRIPVIGPYAKATQMGASAIASIAQLFGFSKPVMLESNLIQPRTKANMAVSNSLDDTNKLTIDQKQEITVDPRTVGLSDADEMSISSIASRPSYLTRFWWTVAEPTEWLLWNTIVDPCVTPRTGQENHLPAVAFTTFPFDYWRGTLRYTFDIVCTGFHKGRLKFVYDPTATATIQNFGTVSAEYNVAFTKIIDISDTQSITIDVPWGQPTTYGHHANFPNDTPAFDTARLNYTSYVNLYGNGTLSVYVVNELQTPSATEGVEIFILVSVSAGPDFEVAAPTSKYISKMRLFPDKNLEGLMPQSQEFRTNTISTTDATNLIHFGESIRSTRQLLKRYVFSEFVPISDKDSPNSLVSTFCRQSLPLDGGYVPGNVYNMPVYSTALGPYVYAANTYLNYFTHAFGGWRGSIRYMVSTADAGCCNVSTMVTHDNTGSYPYSDFVDSYTICDICNPTPSAALSLIYNFYQYTAEGHPGMSVQNNSVNTTHSFELPYYSHYRFTPAKTSTHYFGNTTDTFSRNWYFTVRGQNIPKEANAAIYCAAGDDFSLHMFLGAPVLYAQISYPV